MAKRTLCTIVSAAMIAAFFVITGNAVVMASPLKIVSLAPSTTEILYALGLGASVVGVSAYCDYPDDVSSKTRVGTFSTPDIEKILSLKPDLVVCAGLEQALTVERLRQLNLRVYVSDPKNFEELYASILDIGRLTERSPEAGRLVQEMRERVRKVQEKALRLPPSKKVKVFVDIWNDPLLTAGKMSYIDELITIAGGVNIAFDSPKAYSRFSPELVIYRDPDFILVTYMTSSGRSSEIEKNFGWNGVKAVRRGGVIAGIDPDTLLRPGPRIVEGLERLAARLHP